MPLSSRGLRKRPSFRSMVQLVTTKLAANKEKQFDELGAMKNKSFSNFATEVASSAEENNLERVLMACPFWFLTHPDRAQRYVDHYFSNKPLSGLELRFLSLQCGTGTDSQPHVEVAISPEPTISEANDDENNNNTSLSSGINFLKASGDETNSQVQSNERLRSIDTAAPSLQNHQPLNKRNSSAF